MVLPPTACEQVLWGTSTRRFHAQFGAGLKWMIH
ncbi:MAG: hypothetical protein Q4A89_03550 [Tannerella sp.]|nr:hypothetical protein [Tannerella sp.]MDO4702995.1 hypothetical protein [Tannerella sp.]